MMTLLQSIQPYQALAGVGLFLFAMLLLEQALEGLLGGPFKRYLRAHTRRPAGALLAGTLTTAVLQSSSLVGVMTLALVGAGVIALSSGVGVILGANLGTTMTGWLVTLIGFKLDLEQAALPLVAVGSIGTVTLRQWPRLAQAVRLILALGLLIWALGLMKGAVNPVPEDLSALLTQGQGRYSFFVLGVLVTLVIQSSSAMMMITLSLLAANLLDITQAAAVVVGADLGTTGTVLLGSIGGSAPRRRVAFAHLWFNLVNALIALMMVPLVPLAMVWLGLNDPLIALVGFHTTFNVVGIALFYPLLPTYAKALEKHVQDQHRTHSRYLKRDVVAVAESGVEALHKEAERLVAISLARYRRLFRQSPELPVDLTRAAARYDDLKALEHEIIEYAALLQRCALNAAQAKRLQLDLYAIRNAVHTAKCLKDIQHNLDALDHSEEPALQELWQHVQQAGLDIIEPLLAHYLNDRDEQQPLAEASVPVGAAPAEAIAYPALRQQIEQSHNALHQLIFELEVASEDAEVQLSSLFNMNRELFLAQHNLINAMWALHNDDMPQLA